MSFSDLKKQSKLGSLTSKLVKEVEKDCIGLGCQGRNHHKAVFIQAQGDIS